MSKPLVHTPEGVRDIYGKEYAGKLLLEERLHQALQSFGYQDIQTPTFEFFDVFGSQVGTTPSRELYKFFDKEGNTLVLRPDFTPSVARCAAKYFMGEKLPLRFSYRGSTFTNTSALRGKWKEATQLGAELIQEPSVRADAEMIAMLVKALQAAGLEEFQISVGHVEYFKGLCSQAGLDEETERELRDLIASKNFFGAKELLESRQVRRDYCEVLLRVIDLAGGALTLEKARGLVDNERSLLAVERLEELHRVLREYGVEKYISFDLGLLSKYNYYTGVVFKAYTYGVGDAVAKGGRYDRLLEHFGKEAAAIGFVLVVDDLLEALSRQGKKPERKPEGILILYEEEGFSQALERACQLREDGRAVELSPAAAADGTDRTREAARAHLQREILYFDASGHCREIDC